MINGQMCTNSSGAVSDDHLLEPSTDIRISRIYSVGMLSLMHEAVRSVLGRGSQLAGSDQPLSNLEVGTRSDISNMVDMPV